MTKLKKIFICFLVLAGFSMAYAQQKPEQAAVVLEKALKQAKAENKNVLLMFHASWCSWCKKMEANINSPACKKLFDNNYVMAYVTVKEPADKKALENPGGEALVKRFKGEKHGLPFWVILDREGNMITNSLNSKGENIGCPASPEEVSEFGAKLKKTSKLTNNDLTKIAATFTVK